MLASLAVLLLDEDELLVEDELLEEELLDDELVSDDNRSAIV